MRTVAVVAAEASGDRIAGLAVAALAERGVGAFGIGGTACRAAGVELVADSARLSAMGIADVAMRLPELGLAVARLLARVARSRPAAAILVNATELNQRLGVALRARGVRVLWCVAPQVWAWRPGRLRSLRGAIDRLAVILPFEEPLWRRAGVDAHYVGHPALDAFNAPIAPRDAARSGLEIAALSRALAVLPGSRAGEASRLARPLCRAAARLVQRGVVDEVRVIAASGLTPGASAIVAREAAAAGLPVIAADPVHGAAPLLAAFDASLCASGTASLEAALAGAAPVIAYRMDPLAFAIAKRFVLTPHIALPNVLLGRRAYPELVQGDATEERLTAAARDVLARGDQSERLRAELRAILTPPSSEAFGARVAALVMPWLAG